MGGGNPGGEAAAERTDRPVAAPDDTVPAEACDHMFDIGRQGLCCPCLGIGIGNDAGNLADHVRPASNLRYAGFPRLEGIGADIGNAAMVENELHVGREINKSDDATSLMRQCAEVKGQAAAADAPNIFAEKGAFRNCIGHDMKHAAETLTKGSAF